jgi:hypothetical protein
MKPIKRGVFLTIVLALAAWGCGDDSGGGGGGGTSGLDATVGPNSAWALAYRAGSESDPHTSGHGPGDSISMQESDGKWVNLRLSGSSNSIYFEFDPAIPAEPGTYETSFAKIGGVMYPRDGDKDGDLEKHSFLSGLESGDSGDPVGEPATVVVEAVDDGRLVRAEISGVLNHAYEAGVGETNEVSPPLQFQAAIDDE